MQRKWLLTNNFKHLNIGELVTISAISLWTIRSGKTNHLHDFSPKHNLGLLGGKQLSDTEGIISKVAIDMWLPTSAIKYLITRLLRFNMISSLVKA